MGQTVFEYIANETSILNTFEINQRVEFTLKHQEVKVNEEVQDLQAIIDGDLIIKMKVEGVSQESASSTSAGQISSSANPRQMVTNRTATGPDGTIGFNMARQISCRWNRATNS